MKILDPKKFVEFVKKVEEEGKTKEQEFDEDDAYRETFLNENNILDFLRIAEKEARKKDQQTGVINYIELYQQYEDRQITLFRTDRLKNGKKKTKRKSILM